MEAGLDSLAAVELRNTLSSKYSLDLPASLLFDYPTIAGLASFLLASIQPAEAAMDLQLQAQEIRAPQSEGLSVIGIACQYPGSQSGNIASYSFCSTE